MEYKEALSKHYNKLVGYKIVEVIILEDEEDTEDFMGTPRVVLALTKGKKEIYVEVQSDEEGNGTGFLEIMEMNK